MASEFQFPVYRAASAFDEDLSVSTLRVPPTPPWLTHEVIMKIYRARTTWQYGRGIPDDLMVIVPSHVLTPADQERMAHGAFIFGMPMKVLDVKDFMVAAKVVD